MGLPLGYAPRASRRCLVNYVTQYRSRPVAPAVWGERNSRICSCAFRPILPPGILRY